MPFRVSPGVNWAEKDTTLIVPGTSTSVGAVAGAFRWGPSNAVTTVSSENELVGMFGKPDDDTFESFFLAAGFLAFSDHLKVVRTVGDKARNATSGGDGVDLTVSATVVNGSVTSVSVENGGSGYVAGDIALIETPVTPAVMVVTGVDSGTVTSLELKSGGRGHSGTGSKDAVCVSSVLVRNDDEMENETFSPEIVARYPGTMGNSIVFSAVRASEFDSWAYRDRFGVAPGADVVSFDGDGVKTVFEYPEGMTELPADSVVTVNGHPRTEGVDAGDYVVGASSIEFIEQVETFTGDSATSSFTLANATSLDASEAQVEIDGTASVRYEGAASVPPGYFAIRGGKVVFGVESDTISGDGAATIFTVPGAAGATDIQFTVDGVGTVDFTTADSGDDLEVTFGTAPKFATDNIVARWAYPSGTVVVRYGAPHAGDDSVKVFSNQNEIHAVVVDADATWTDERFELLERFDFLSTERGTKSFDGSTKYYVDAINRKSAFVRLGGTITQWGGKRLTGGADDNGADAITPGIKQTALAKFANAEEVDIAHLIVGAADAATVKFAIENVAMARRDCVAYWSVPREAVINNTGREAKDSIAFRNKLGSSSYAHPDSGWKLTYDRYNDVTRWVPCAADSAGCYAWTADNVDPWYSGAGLNRGRIRNSIRLAWVPNETDRDLLYANGINPVVNFRNEGAVLWGDKTMQSKPSAFDRMNVRWLFIVLEKSIAEAARYNPFEFNDEGTRGHFKNTVNPFLSEVMGRKGISDFKVVCDETNNPGVVVDRNEFVADILIKPARSINYVQLNFVAVGTDVSFEEALQ